MNKKFLLGIPVGAALSVIMLGLAISASAATTYTAAQVAAHNTAADCWQSINGKVYNLTTFIPIHPGGQAAIIQGCGQDTTAGFNAGPHGPSQVAALQTYYIGDLAAAPVLTTVHVTPATPAIAIGGTSQLAAAGLDQNNAAMSPAPSFTWTSSNTTVATVNSSGLVTAVSAGSATITATSGTVSGATIVSVTASSTGATTPPTTGGGSTPPASGNGTTRPVCSHHEQEHESEGADHANSGQWTSRASEHNKGKHTQRHGVQTSPNTSSREHDD